MWSGSACHGYFYLDYSLQAFLLRIRRSIFLIFLASVLVILLSVLAILFFKFDQSIFHNTIRITIYNTFTIDYNTLLFRSYS